MRNRLFVLGLALFLAPVVHADDSPPPGNEITFLGEHWTRLTPPIFEVPVVDPIRSRVLLLPFGHDAAPGEYWELDLSPGSRWRKNAWANPGPDWNIPIRAIAYDPSVDRLIALAGSQAPANLTVWALNLGGDHRWVELHSTGQAPSDRSKFALVFDSRRNRHVLFGGNSGNGSSSIRNDLWALKIAGEDATWTALETEGDSVSGHYDVGAIYDEKRDRMVVIGGGHGLPGGGAIEPSDDLLTLEFGTRSRWKVYPRHVTPSGLEYQPRCLYEPTGDRMLVFGGATSSPIAIPLDDLTISGELTPGARLPGTLALAELSDGDAIAVSGLCEVRSFRPDAFNGFKRLDPSRDAIESLGTPSGPSFAGGRNGVVYYWGGFLEKRQGSEHELWRFDIHQDPHWSKQFLESRVPAPRQGAAITYDGRRHRWLMYGGWSTSPPFARFDELWAFDPLLARWSPIEFSRENGPGALEGAAAAYDGIRDRLILFGGRRDANSIAETWALALDSGMRWSRIAVSGRQPRARGNATMVWDPTRDRIVLFGGLTRSTGSFGGISESPRRDMWALNLADSAAWDTIAASPGPPVPRGLQFGWFDPARGAIDAISGTTWGFPDPGYAPVWLRSFSLEGAGGWGNPTDGTWSPEWTSAAAFDRETDRLFVFGFSDLNQAFVLDRGHPAHQAYLDLQPRGGGLRGKPSVTIAVLGDPLLDVMTLDLGSITFAGAHALPQRGDDHSSIRDVNGDGIVDRLLGFDGVSIPSGTRVVRLDGKTVDGVSIFGFDLWPGGGLHRLPLSLAGDPDSPMDTIRPLGLFANGIGRLRLDLPSRSHVTVEIFGVNGRKISGRELGQLNAGSHDLADLGMEGSAAGVYFAVIRAEGVRLRAKLIKI